MHYKIDQLHVHVFNSLIPLHVSHYIIVMLHGGSLKQYYL